MVVINIISSGRRKKYLLSTIFKYVNSTDIKTTKINAIFLIYEGVTLKNILKKLELNPILLSSLATEKFTAASEIKMNMVNIKKCIRIIICLSPS